MTAFLIYAIRWAVVLTMLYSLYALLMKRETLHGVNRLVLLLILVASMVLPLCQFKTGEGNAVAEGRERLEQQIAVVSTTRLAVGMPTTTGSGWQEHHVNAAVLMLIGIYLIGLAVAWLRYFSSLGVLLGLIWRSKRIVVEGLPKGVVVLTHPSVKTPCSWMHWMLLSPADVQSRPIILHELSHIQLRHSWDMLLCDLTCRMLWCVPFAWMLRQDLRDVHEYQADRRVLRSGVKDEEYQLLLIRKATGTGLQTVVNALNQSPIKRRLKMMYTQPSRRWVALKAVYLLPLGALSLVAFARPQALTEIEKTVEQEVTNYTDVVKTLVELEKTADEAAAEAIVPTVAEYTIAEPTAEASLPAEEPTAASEADETEDWSIQLVAVAHTQTDANLVRADLRDNPDAAAPTPALTERKSMAVLDSVMLAVGARKIADGAYIGHFQPSLNNDTVRLAQVEFLDKASSPVIVKTFQHHAADPYAYKMTLQAATRKDEKGYYIRYLTPVKTTDWAYDKPKNTTD